VHGWSVGTTGEGPKRKKTAKEHKEEIKKEGKAWGVTVRSTWRPPGGKSNSVTCS